MITPEKLTEKLVELAKGAAEYEERQADMTSAEREKATAHRKLIGDLTLHVARGLGGLIIEADELVTYNKGARQVVRQATEEDRRVLDGFHRVRAFLEKIGPEKI